MATSIYEFAQLPPVRTGPTSWSKARQARAPGEAPQVGVIYNPRSHRNRGADLDCGMSPHVFISQPGDRSQLPQALAELAERGIDLLVINGGDGTVRDVLTSGHSIFGENWPAIAVLPKGKTNALTTDLGIPIEWSLQDAIDAFDAGGRDHRRPIEISSADNASSTVLGFILGAGSFMKATQAAQSAHRLGAFNSLAVAATTGWTVLQSVFGSRKNIWRIGSRMNIELGPHGAPLAHSGVGDPEFRQLLFASTLESFPADIMPFGQLRKGLKLVALDQVARRSMALVPLIVTGRVKNGLRERGFHQVAVPDFTLDIDDPFIFDGEAFPAGQYRIGQGPELEFVTTKSDD